ncbi:molecular chaperone [Providencia heimbachae]|uniref:fimbrial biogenesis chaperone n=1 Tax=Providencia heimbachae TaxID=333962 RepID=UPI0010BEE246|nr:molecular chaperone [Providencia heimbachae]QCJ69371.1 molecular chaperone [Providencia heimbachae]
MYQRMGVLYFAVSLFALLISFQANAGLRIEQSRIIWSAEQTQKSIILTNDSQEIYLIQTGVFDSPTGTKETQFFTVIPPLYRLNSNSQQSMRLLLQDSINSLPKDRESIFYFSTIAIPGSTPESKNTDSAQLSIGTRLVIKLFYRPIEFTQSPENAISNLNFSSLRDGLCLNNESPYFITLSNLKIQDKTLSNLAGMMIPPYSQQKIALPQVITSNTKIEWQAINDFGGDTHIYSTSIIPSKADICQ